MTKESNQTEPSAKIIFDTAFLITGRGLVIGCRILEGNIGIGNHMELLLNGSAIRSAIIGIESIRVTDPEKAGTIGIIVKTATAWERDSIQLSLVSGTIINIFSNN